MKYYFLLLFIIFCKLATTQELQLIIIDNKQHGIENTHHIRGEFADIKTYAQTIIDDLHDTGYISASIDTFVLSGDTLFASIYTGEQYFIGHFEIEGMTVQERRKARIRLRQIYKQAFSKKLLAEINQKISQYFANQGYPFCELISEVTVCKESELSLQIKVKKNEQITIGAVHIKGDAEGSGQFIQNYLSLQAGAIYNEKTIDAVSQKISELGFIQEIRRPSVEFYDDEADVYLYLKRQTANRFNGIAGLTADSLNDNKLRITGDLNVELHDNFKQGEYIALQWNRTEPQAQSLKIEFGFPYPFGLSVEPQATAVLDKTDKDFMNVSISGGIDYIFPNNSRLLFKAKYLNSAVLNEEVEAKLNNSKHLLFNLGYAANRLNYKHNPASGYSFVCLFGTGNRKQSSKQETLYTTDLQGSYYFPLYKNFVFKAGIHHRSIFSESSLYDNELYKYGGYKTMRGFDENQFKSSQYTTLSGEIRFLYEKDAALYLFSDWGYFTDNQKEKQFLAAFGPGANINTKAGIFSINYALGKQQNAPLQLADSKIHLAYVNRF